MTVSDQPVTDEMIRQYIDAFAAFRVAQSRYEALTAQVKTVDGLLEFAETEADTFVCPAVQLPSGFELEAAVNERRVAGAYAAALWRAVSTEPVLGHAPALLRPFL